MIGKALEDSYAIILAYQKEHTKRYNIFKVLEMTDREVLMCRVLTDFLNPEGFHGKGDKFLRIFLEHILRREDTEEICASARVYKEYPITEDRRIDIVIEAKNVFIPIEVKIHAEEQRAQCFDYYKYAKQKDDYPQVVYLTKRGSMPSEFSMKSADGAYILLSKEVLCISFEKHICDFMDRIIATEEELVIQEMARQYKEAVKSFTEVIDKELQMQVAEKLLETEQNFRSMLVIEHAAKKAKAKLIYILMQELEVQMEPLLNKYGLIQEQKYNWYPYKTQATEAFYAQRESTYPGINYLFKNICLPEGLQLWLRIEVDYKLFAGLCLFDTKTGEEFPVEGLQSKQIQSIREKLVSYLNLEHAQYMAWWVQWWYLPTASDNDKLTDYAVPDFKEMNEAAIVLSDREKRMQFVSKCVEMIDYELEKLIK